MHNLMMASSLTINSLMTFAEKVHPNTEIVSVTLDNPHHRYTFADAFRRSRQLANALLALGATAGDRIGTLAWNDYRHFELYYAVGGLGMICHTVNPRLFPEQIDYIINHAQDRILFIDPVFVPLIEQLAEQLKTVEKIVVLTSAEQMPETTLNNVFCYETLLAFCTPENLQC